MTVGAVLDRNGLRPSRYKIDQDGLVVAASEVGVVDMDDVTIVEKGGSAPARCSPSTRSGTASCITTT